MRAPQISSAGVALVDAVTTVLAARRRKAKNTNPAQLRRAGWDPTRRQNLYEEMK